MKFLEVNANIYIKLGLLDHLEFADLSIDIDSNVLNSDGIEPFYIQFVIHVHINNFRSSFIQ